MTPTRTALVSDGSTPVGQAVVRVLKERGWQVAANLPAPADAIRSTEAPRADLVLRHPLGPARDAAAMVDRVVSAWGGLGALVCTADAMHPIRVEDGDEAVFIALMEQNAKSAFFLSQAAARTMDRGAGGPGGSIVVVGSIHGEKPTGGSFGYAASMGALKMLCREAALDLGRRGVRVNLLEVGALEDADQRFPSDLSDLYTEYDRKVPLPSGPGRPEDVAAAVAFLLSEEACFLHGAEIRLDGGFTLHYMDHKMRRASDG